MAHVNPGDVVRTKKVWPGGLHKVPVVETFKKGDELWAKGEGWEFPACDLEVVRPAVSVH